jgi:hypothetical protein
LPATVKSADKIGLVERMRDKAGHLATVLTIRARPQMDSRKPRL